MRIVLGRMAGSVAPLAGAATGALVAVHDRAGAAVGRATADACASDLPATAARCATDHAVADVGPFLAPALVGGFVGLVVATVVLMILGGVARARRRRAAGPAVASVPSCVVLPGPGSETGAPGRPAVPEG